MNLYATLNDLKEQLAITTAEKNAQLMRILTMASRQIEKPKLAGRQFYCWEGTKYYSNVRNGFWLPDDVLSITTLKCDPNGDGVYEVSMADTDYHLSPLSTYPKIYLEINPNGDYASFAPGIVKGLEIIGVFGYADSATPYEVKTALAEDINSIVTEFLVTIGREIKIGQTIRINDEQMFVEDIIQNTLHVKRPVNGTTSDAHSTSDEVEVYLYPEDITQAVMIMTMRAWKRKDSAYQDVVGIPETGQTIRYKGIDPDVAELVAPYRRQEYC